MALLKLDSNDIYIGSSRIKAMFKGSTRIYFNPLSLFSNGIIGTWFDPSDLSTLFQDASGTQPVTTAGQPVGLMLDKSNGLTYGPELVTNGDLSTSSNWTLGTGWSISNGVASANIAAGNHLDQNLTTTINQSYQVTYTITSYTSGNIRARFSGTTNISGTIRAAIGTYTEIIHATATNSILRITGGSTGFVGSIDNISVKLLAGNHAIQVTSGQRPTYQIDINGRAYLSFDGIDDNMITSTITPSLNNVQVFAGVKKLDDSAQRMVVEFGNANIGSFQLEAPHTPNVGNYMFTSGGSNNGAGVATVNGFTAPNVSILTGIGSISEDVAILRVNGTQVATSTADQGTGNYLAYPLYIGSRGGSSLRFNGYLYGLIVRFSPANIEDSSIIATESWLTKKTE